MKVLKYILIPAFVLCAKAGIAQYWDTLGSGINGGVAQVRALYSDSSTQKLYVGGYFAGAGGITSQHVACWNGTSWDSLGPGLADQAFTFETYNNKVIVGGNFRAIGNDFSYRSLATWDGNQWDSIPGIPAFPDNPTIWCLKVYNNELYVGGAFDSIAGMNNLTSIVKWNGTNWVNLNLPIINPPFAFTVTAIEFFQGKMFVGGNFNIASTTDTMSDLFMWDGVNVSQVGIGINGGMSGVNSMAVYNGELYIGGYFAIADGNAGNHICKWDGSTLTEVGGGMNNMVHQLKVINNELYAVGVFLFAGNVVVNGIAKWNGQRWCALEGVFDGPINVITDFYNEIYVGGGFQMINSDSFSRIAKWIGGNYTDTCSVVGINDVESNENGLEIYPNPTDDAFTLSLLIERPAKNLIINVYNSLGQLVAKEEHETALQNFQTTILIANVPDGIYLIQVIAEGKPHITKLIKRRI